MKLNKNNLFKIKILNIYTKKSESNNIQKIKNIVQNYFLFKKRSEK